MADNVEPQQPTQESTPAAAEQPAESAATVEKQETEQAAVEPAPVDTKPEEPPAAQPETDSQPAAAAEETPAAAAVEETPAATAETPAATTTETADGAAAGSEVVAAEEPVKEEESQPEVIEIPKGNGELVLVTGATGYLASYIVKQLVESGEFRVRGSVRKLEENEKLDKLKSLLEEGKVEFVEADLEKPESWAEAVKDCDYVIHTASPFPTEEPANAQDVVDPAVNGTLSVLKACSEAGSVKRVIFTSSCVAMSSGRAADKKPLTEEDWADVEKTQRAYDKSKTMAEKAAWDFMKELPEGNTMELSVVNPGLIIGPPLYKMECTSVEIVKKLMNGDFPMLPKICFPVVDVRDAALCHIRAMMIKQSNAKRHILSNSSLWLKEIANILSQEFKGKGFKITTTQAPYILVWLNSLFDPSLKSVMPQIGKHYLYDNGRMKTVLQVEPRGVKDSLTEMGHTMINMGIVEITEKQDKKKKLSMKRKKEKAEEHEEKKDEPEKIKEGSANGSPAESGSVHAEEAPGEITEKEKQDEVKEAASDTEKPAEEGAVASSEEEVKEDAPEKVEKKEKPKKEKKKGSIFSKFSFKRNKHPEVEKKEKVEAEATTSAEKPAESIEEAASAETTEPVVAETTEPAVAEATEVAAAESGEKAAAPETEEKKEEATAAAESSEVVEAQDAAAAAVSTEKPSDPADPPASTE